MKSLVKLAMAALLVAPVTVAAKVTSTLSFSCEDHATGTATPNLHGTWDFVMDVAGTPNFGQLSLGFVGKEHGGSLALWLTAPVVVRELTVTRGRFRMAVASPAGDVVFEGAVSSQADRLCGTVLYHDGRAFAAVAQKRPSTYQSLPVDQRRAEP